MVSFVSPCLPVVHPCTKVLHVATLALGSWPRQRGCKGVGQEEARESHPILRECRKVWGSEPSHSQSNSHFGRWSPGGFSKLQRPIWEIKTQWIVEFFISLESSWNLDVYNGLTLLIWTSETQVMAKRRVGSQIDNLTPDQKKSGIDPIYLASDDVPHTVGKLSTRATTFL
jgi:hypothetical protein